MFKSVQFVVKPVTLLMHVEKIPRIRESAIKIGSQNLGEITDKIGTKKLLELKLLSKGVALVRVFNWGPIAKGVTRIKL